ncbi:MAG: hypothetical protein K6A63_08780 [Acholeplasmatales bacterium]|nr:hypothetical protein [Acholeplasmatales bacterium]
MISLLFNPGLILLYILFTSSIVFALTAFRKKRSLMLTFIIIGLVLFGAYAGVFIHYFVTIEGLEATYSEKEDTYTIEGETYYNSGFRVDSDYESENPKYAHTSIYLSCEYLATYSSEYLEGIDDGRYLYLNQENLDILNNNIYFELIYCNYNYSYETDPQLKLNIGSDLKDEITALIKESNDDSLGLTEDEYCTDRGLDSTDAEDGILIDILCLDSNLYHMGLDINYTYAHQTNCYYIIRAVKRIGSYKYYFYDVNKYKELTIKLNEFVSLI